MIIHIGIKSNYKQIDMSLSDKNPVKEINMLWACRWILSAWDEIQPSTIDHCWCKSTLLGPYQGAQRRPDDYQDPTILVAHDIQQLGAQLQQAGRIRGLMDINNFIDPIDESTGNEPENIIEHIAAQFGPEKDAESDEEDIEQPKIKISEALAALQQLRLYEEQQDESDSGFLSLLNKYEQRIQDRRMKESQQMP